MNRKDGSVEREFDPDVAPDLSKDGWPEKFAKVRVRRGRSPEVRRGQSPEVRRGEDSRAREER